MQKTVEHAVKCLREATRLIVDLTRRGYDPGECAMILSAAAVHLQHLGNPEGDIKHSANWFRDAMIEVYKNTQLNPEIKRLLEASEH
jgi:hypothetical protein